MTETSYFWAGTTVGDAINLAPYTNDEISDVMRQAFQFDRDYTLPSFNYVFNPEVNPRKPLTIRISEQTQSIVLEPGVALVDGKIYFITLPKAFACNVDGYYRLVLRKTFPAIVDDLPTGQTVRAEMLYAEKARPEPTRTDDQTWEVTIATFLNASGVITFDDDGYNYWRVSNYASGVTTEDNNRVFPEACINIPARLGGSATNWGTAGTTKYVVPVSRIEVGSVTIDANPKAHTFAEAFPYTPIVILTPHERGVASNWAGNNFCISALSAAGFSIRFDDRTNLEYVEYMAIGPIF